MTAIFIIPNEKQTFLFTQKAKLNTKKINKLSYTQPEKINYQSWRAPCWTQSKPFER